MIRIDLSSKDLSIILKDHKYYYYDYSKRYITYKHRYLRIKPKTKKQKRESERLSRLQVKTTESKVYVYEFRDKYYRKLIYLLDKVNNCIKENNISYNQIYSIGRTEYIFTINQEDRIVYQTSDGLKIKSEELYTIFNNYFRKLYNINLEKHNFGFSPKNI
jgi:hypothetical protein